MKKRFEVLDVARGVFATMIVFFHMSAFTNTPVINNNFINNSDLFVDFFFVLSGFVIMHNYRRLDSLAKLKIFFKKRLLRLYPLHLIMLMSFAILVGAKDIFLNNVQLVYLDNPNNNLMSFISSILLLKAVKFPGVNGSSWNIATWSVSAEMISYAFFGGMMLFVYEIKKPEYRKYLSIAIVMVSMVTIALIKGNARLNYTYDVGYLRGLAGFFTGVLCNNTFISLRKRMIHAKAAYFHIAESILLLLIAFFIYEGELFAQIGIIYLLLFFLSVLIFAFEKGFISSMLQQSGILRRMGKYSYSIYMTHTVVLIVFNFIFIHLLQLPSSAYVWLFAPNCLLIYELSKWTNKHIEQRFAYKEKQGAEVQHHSRNNGLYERNSDRNSTVTETTAKFL